MRMPKPMGERGRRSRRWQQWRMEQRAAVWRRSKQCEVPDCPMPAQEWCHIFMRGHLVSEPLASHAAFTCGMCRPHHTKVTREPGCQEELVTMHIAIERGWLLAGASWFSQPMTEREDYIGEARQIEDTLKNSPAWVQLLLDAGRE
jgi:hypothetical protein